MKHATYIGSIAHLKGKTALIQTAGEYVLAQFDDRNLTWSGKPIPLREVLVYEPHARFPSYDWIQGETPPTDALGFNWHKFPKTDFEETP